MVPIGQEAGWAPELTWTQRLDEKSSCLYQGSNLDRLVVQSTARHYTDWATPALLMHYNLQIQVFIYVYQSYTFVIGRRKDGKTNNDNSDTELRNPEGC
jgi:hypothetical protein